MAQGIYPQKDYSKLRQLSEAVMGFVEGEKQKGQLGIELGRRQAVSTGLQDITGNYQEALSSASSPDDETMAGKRALAQMLSIGQPESARAAEIFERNIRPDRSMSLYEHYLRDPNSVKGFMDLQQEAKPTTQKLDWRDTKRTEKRGAREFAIEEQYDTQTGKPTGATQLGKEVSPSGSGRSRAEDILEDSYEYDENRMPITIRPDVNRDDRTELSRYWENQSRLLRSQFLQAQRDKIDAFDVLGEDGASEIEPEIAKIQTDRQRADAFLKATRLPKGGAPVGGRWMTVPRGGPVFAPGTGRQAPSQATVSDTQGKVKIRFKVDAYGYNKGQGGTINSDEFDAETMEKVQ